jgi:hypothetical protein
MQEDVVCDERMLLLLFQGIIIAGVYYSFIDTDSYSRASNPSQLDRTGLESDMSQE